jgi:CheY-like chemotaxis protein
VKQKQILIVEDNEPNQFVFSIMAEHLFKSPKVFIANNSEEAYNILEFNRIDVAIVDVNLDHSTDDGLQVAAEIKKNNPTSFVIISSASSESSYNVERLKKEGIIDTFVPKPLTIELLKRLTEAVREK